MCIDLVFTAFICTISKPRSHFQTGSTQQELITGGRSMKKNLVKLLMLTVLVASLGLFGCSGDDGKDGTNFDPAVAAGMQDQIDALTADLAASQAELQAAIDANAASDDASVSELQGQIDDLSADLVAAQVALQAAIDANASDISANADGVAANAQAITDLQTQIATITTELESVQSTLAGVVADLAAMTAEPLALLPQADITVLSVEMTEVAPAAVGDPVINTTFKFVENPAYVGGLFATNASGSSFSYVSFGYAQLTATPADAVFTPQWIRFTSGDSTASHLTNNGDGTYTMSTTVTDTNFNAANTTRLFLAVRGVTNQVAPLNLIYDFVPNGGPATLSRDVVTEDACVSCHNNVEGSSDGISGIHGGRRYLVAACVVCHADRANSSSGTQGISVGREMVYFIHSIHAAINQGTTTDAIRGRDNWSEVTYPESLKNCQKCHNGVVDADNYLIPTILACTGCHATTTFVGTATHSGGAQVDANCYVCHPKTGTGFGMSVAAAHDITTDPGKQPEFGVNITLSAPASGTFYAVGETPTVTVTLSPLDEGAAALYTAAKGATGSRDGVLSNASLYVYGPRAKAVPVLTKGSTTDPAYNPANNPTQGHQLFIGGTDAQVITDASGFKYQLLPITADMAGGTYMVRFEGADFGYVTDLSQVTSSTNVVTFQVKTATEEAIVGGNCFDCHGTNRMHYDGAHAHNAAFATDHCLACHDTSGNYGDYIGNRVHAIHNASETGDLHSVNWDEITYPQASNNCAKCHADDGILYTFNAGACVGCHSDASDHMTANGVGYVLGDATNLGATRPQIQATYADTAACTTCHSAGKLADTALFHKAD
jgi:OmcA/MtrC family decaheme c-type cytochrome